MQKEKVSQTDKLWNLLKDGQPVRTDRIQVEVYGNSHAGLARVGARIYDIKQKYGVEIKGWHDLDYPSLYWYQIVMPEARKIMIPSAPITELNDRIATIMQGKTVSWETAHEFKELEQALKSNNEYLKRSVIAKYLPI